MKRFIYIFILLFFTVPTSVFAGNPPDQTKSTITNTAAPADGATSSTVTIVLNDADGHVLTGTDSILLTSSDSTAIFAPSSFTLDGSGKITTNMKARTVGNVPLQLKDVSTYNTVLTWNIPFYQPGTNSPTPTPTPAPGACTDAAPGSTAQLTSALSSDAHSITLTWTDAAHPVSYYLLSYGLSAGNYIYGVPNIGRQGTTSFTVGGLSTGTKYYFAVRAGNGCTPGNFSNELSAVAGVDTGVPTDTPEAAAIPPVPTDTPDLSVDTPTPTPAPAPAEVVTPAPAGGGSNAFVNTLMAGVTALGVVCVIVGVIVYLRMQKRTY